MYFCEVEGEVDDLKMKKMEMKNRLNFFSDIQPGLINQLF